MAEVTLDDLIRALQEQRRVDGGKVPITVSGDIEEVVELWKPENVPATVQFSWYIHDNSEGYELALWIAEKTVVPGDHPVLQQLDNPFYEIGFKCELDTTTGKISILGLEDAE